MSIRETVHRAFNFDGRRSNRVADAINIPRTSLVRFVNQQRGLQFDYLEALCKHLDLQLVRQVDDFEAFCRERWNDGGREDFRVDLEGRRDELWEQYLEANWSPDDSEFETYAKQQFREYSRTAWPAYAEDNSLDVADPDEVASWRQYEYDPFCDSIREDWEDKAKAEWIELERDDWTSRFDEPLEDEDQLFELYCDEMRDLARDQDWLLIRGKNNG